MKIVKLKCRHKLTAHSRRMLASYVIKLPCNTDLIILLLSDDLRIGSPLWPRYKSSVERCDYMVQRDP
jgi:hypothetical protein